MSGRIEDSGSIGAELPPLDRAYQIDFRLLSDRLAEIPDDVNGILKLFDGRRTLAQVLEQADQDGVAAAKVLAKLWSEEIIRPAPPARPQESASPRPLAEGGGASETTAAVQPEPAEWFAGPAEDERPRALAAAAKARPAVSPEPDEAAGAAPRIVRFPPRRKEPVTSLPDEAISARLLEAAGAAQAPQGNSLRSAAARRNAARRMRMRRRSLAALLVAGCVLTAVGIWRAVGSRSEVPAGATADPASTSTSTSTAAPSAHSLAGASEPPASPSSKSGAPPPAPPKDPNSPPAAGAGD